MTGPAIGSADHELGSLLIGLVLGVLLLELLVWVGWRWRTGRWPVVALWSTLAGAALVMGLRAAWLGQGLAALAAWLAAAGLCHAAQVLASWRAAPPRR